jgi:phosphatidylinositol-3-phosphatase
MRRVLVPLIAGIALAVPASPALALPPVKHVFVIVLENKGVEDTFGPTGFLNAPYLSQELPSKGQLLLRYYGIGHNSLDNYIAMVSGQPPTPKTKDDCPDPLTSVGTEAVPPYNLAKGDGCTYPDNFRTIADQLAARHLRWKGYNQDIPAPCSMVKSAGDYARKHNPFVFFDSLRESGQCQANDVGLDQLTVDLKKASKTPNLAFIVPNQCDDGHSACPSTFPIGNPITDDQDGLRQADAFLKVWVPRILASPAYKKDGLLIVTFDEAVEMTACCNEQPGPADPNPGGYADGLPGPGGGDTGSVLISKFISPGSVNANEYNHYSLLRSLEDLFGLKHLGYAGKDGLVPFGDDVFNAATAGTARRSARSG